MTKRFIEVDNLTQMLLEKLRISEAEKPREIEDPNPYEISIASRWQEENYALRVLIGIGLTREALAKGYVSPADDDPVAGALIKSLDDADAGLERVRQATEPDESVTMTYPPLEEVLNSFAETAKGSSSEGHRRKRAEYARRWTAHYREIVKAEIRKELDGE